jgi:hypothetical protein
MSAQPNKYEVDDAFEGNELFQRNGWTDGLPIVPPTADRVANFLDHCGLEPNSIVGVEPVRQRRISAGKVATNAVMAGCLPTYMPVVVTTIQAMCEPAFSLHGCSVSTGGSAPFVVVNGPIRPEIGMSATHSVFASGSRANATIGRAIHLVLRNVLGTVPGQMDRSTLSHPGKLTFCIAEDEEDCHWLTLAQERGAPAGSSAVTVMACESPHQIMNEWTQNPREVLETFVAAIRSNMLCYSIWDGNYALVIPKQLREVFKAAGWQKRDIREYVFAHARVVRRQWRDVGKAGAAERGDEARVFTALRSPDDLLVIAAGGPAGGFGAMVPPWYGNKSVAVTRTITGS